MTGISIRAAGGREWPAGEQPANIRREAKAAGCVEVRRGNRLSCMATIGALDCVAAGRGRPAADTPVHLASSYGNVAATAALVEDLLREGETPSPLEFINASTNMPGFYVARELGLEAAGLMLARGGRSILAALELLGHDAREGQHLVGAVEECAWPLEAHRRRLRLPPDTPLAEASYWLWLDGDCDRPIAILRWLQRFEDPAELQRVVDDVGDDVPLSLAYGPGASAEAIALPPRAALEPLPGDCPHARIARLLVEFSLRPEPGRLLLIDREPASVGCIALLLERTHVPVAEPRRAENAS